MPNQYRQLVADLLLFYRNNGTLNSKPDPNLLISKLSGWGSQAEIEKYWLDNCFMRYSRPNWRYIANTIMALTALASHRDANNYQDRTTIKLHINALTNVIVTISQFGNQNILTMNEAEAFQHFITENEPAAPKWDHSKLSINQLIERLKDKLKQYSPALALRTIQQSESNFLHTLICEELGFSVESPLTTLNLNEFSQCQQPRLPIDIIIRTMLESHSTSKLTPNLSKTFAMMLENLHTSVCFEASGTDVPKLLMLHYHENSHEFWFHHTNIHTIQGAFSRVSIGADNPPLSVGVNQWSTAIVTYHESTFDPIILKPQNERLELILIVNTTLANTNSSVSSSPSTPRSEGSPALRPQSEIFTSATSSSPTEPSKSSSKTFPPTISPSSSSSATLPRNFSLRNLLSQPSSPQSPRSPKDSRFNEILAELNSDSAKSPLEFLKEIITCALEPRNFSLRLSPSLNRYPSTKSGDVILNLLNYGQEKYPSTSLHHYGDCYYRYFRLMICSELGIDDQILTNAHLHVFAQTTLFLLREQKRLTENLSVCIAGLRSSGNSAIDLRARHEHQTYVLSRFTELRTVVMASPSKAPVKAAFNKQCQNNPGVVTSLVAVASDVQTHNQEFDMGPIVWWLNILEYTEVNTALFFELNYVCSLPKPSKEEITTVSTKFALIKTHYINQSNVSEPQQQLQKLGAQDTRILPNLRKLVEICEQDASTNIYCPTILWWIFMLPTCFELTIDELLKNLTTTMSLAANPSEIDTTTFSRRFANLKYATMKTSRENDLQVAFQRRCQTNGSTLPALLKLANCCTRFENTYLCRAHIFWCAIIPVSEHFKRKLEELIQALPVAFEIIPDIVRGIGVSLPLTAISESTRLFQNVGGKFSELKRQIVATPCEAIVQEHFQQLCTRDKTIIPNLHKLAGYFPDELGTKHSILWWIQLTQPARLIWNLVHEAILIDNEENLTEILCQKDAIIRSQDNTRTTDFAQRFQTSTFAQIANPAIGDLKDVAANSKRLDSIREALWTQYFIFFQDDKEHVKAVLIAIDHIADIAWNHLADANVQRSGMFIRTQCNVSIKGFYDPTIYGDGKYMIP